MKKQYTKVFLIFTLCLISSFVGNIVIKNYFPVRVVSDDLLFRLFSYNIYWEYISDTIFFIMTAYFIFGYVVKNKEELLDIINMASIMYIFRALFMILTPLMRPTGVDYPSHGIFRNYIVQYGMFPSGHVALPALMYFIIAQNSDENLKRNFLILLILHSVIMVISRGHYSIDVIGGIMLSYIVVNEYRKK